MGHALGLGEVEQDRAAPDEGRAVVEQQRRARGQARDEPVPHHPAAGGEVEQPVARLDVAVQLVLLQVLQQRAAGAVHDALGHAGRARGIQDVERMVERQLREVDLAARAIGRDEIVQRARALRHAPTGRGRSRDVGHDDDALARDGSRCDDLAPPWRASRAPCRCSSSRRRRTAPCGSIWPKRSSTPCTPKSGEHDDQMAPMLAAASIADHRLRHVRQVAGDAVARPARPRRAAPAPGATPARRARRAIRRRWTLSSPQNTSASRVVAPRAAGSRRS